MKKIAFHNRKGGVGKSTLAGSCGHLAARRGVNTVLVDGDSQGNLTSWFVTGDYRYELADWLMTDGKIPLDQVLVSLGDNLSILPTSGQTGLLKDYAETKLIRQPKAFDRLNEVLEALGFELAVYDLGPGMSQLERVIISSCDETVLPVAGEFFSIDGVETVVREIQEINRGFDKDVRYGRLVVNALNRSFARHRGAFEHYRQLDFEIFTVLQDAKIAESQYAHQPLHLYDPHNKRSLPELERLTESITEGV